MRLDEQDIEAVLGAYRSGWLTMGPRVLALEEALSHGAGTAFAIVTTSWESALHLALLGLGAGPGVPVRVGAGSDACLGTAARLCGAPVEVSDRLAAGEVAVGPGEGGVLRAVSAPPLAVGAGTTVADLAGAAALTAFGGVVLTDDERQALSARSLRSHAMTSGSWDRHRGHASDYDVVAVGFNYRMDEPRAALALSRLTSDDRPAGAGSAAGADAPSARSR